MKIDRQIRVDIWFVRGEEMVIGCLFGCSIVLEIGEECEVCDTLLSQGKELCGYNRIEEAHPLRRIGRLENFEDF